jgi:hypothetical protein
VRTILCARIWHLEYAIFTLAFKDFGEGIYLARSVRIMGPVE